MLTARDGEIDRVARARARRRRLRDQAVLAPRARRPGEGDPAPGRRRRAGTRQRCPPGPHDRRRRGRHRAGRGPGRRRRRPARRPASSRCSLYLAENKGLALSRRQLLDGAWGADWYGDERTVDVHVRQLRKKMGDALPLTTVRGIGYRLGLTAPAHRSSSSPPSRPRCSSRASARWSSPASARGSTRRTSCASQATELAAVDRRSATTRVRCGCSPTCATR